MNNLRPKWELLLSLLPIVFVVAIAYFLTTYIGVDTLRERVADAGWIALALIITAKATTIIVAPLGGTIIYPIAGAAYGILPGLGVTLIGDFVGSTVAFFLSRWFGSSILNTFTSRAQAPLITNVLTQLEDRTAFVWARISAAGFMDLFAYAAGLTKVPYGYFILVHMLVHTPIAALYTAFGDILIHGNWITTALYTLIVGGLAAFGASRLMQQAETQKNKLIS